MSDRTEKMHSDRQNGWSGLGTTGAKGLFFLCAFLLCAAAAVHGQVPARRGSVSNMKIGFSRIALSGPTYTLKENTATTSVSNSDAMTGNQLLLEYIFFGRIGLELDFGVPELTRTYELQSDGATLSTVTEKAQAILLGLNLYFSSHETPGVKPYFGLGAGQITVDHEFNGGTLGSQSSSQSLQLNVLKVGLDWIRENSGLRVEVFSWTGEDSDTTAIAGYTQTISYTATGFSIGVFVFF